MESGTRRELDIGTHLRVNRVPCCLHVPTKARKIELSDVLRRLLPNRQDGNYLCERGGIPLAKVPIPTGHSPYMLVDIISRITQHQSHPDNATQTDKGRGRCV